MQSGLVSKKRNPGTIWATLLTIFWVHVASQNCYFFEDPQGGRPPPHFYSRRFCRSVCRRTQSIRRRRNVKGNFAWGSYGRFSAGSWRILGGSSASSRLNFGKFSAKSLQVLGSSRQNLGKFSADRKTSKGCQKDSLREAKRPLREAKRPPGCPKGAEKGAKRRPKAPQNHKKTSLYFQTVF